MRFLIHFQLTDPLQYTLPLNYQYELSAWIYNTIHFADPAFSAWLHERGYSSGAQRFKFFTFSNLILPHGNFRIDADRLIIKGNTCSLQISFLIEDAAVPFITGIFSKQDFALGDRISKVPLKVNTIEQLPEPVFTHNMEFKTLSPVLVSKSRLADGGNGTAYLAPDHPDYERLFFQNLKRKVAVALGENEANEAISDKCSLEITGTPIRKGITIKAHTNSQTKVIAYQYKFKIHAPAHWLRVGYFAGFGEKNSEGMGCVEIK